MNNPLHPSPHLAELLSRLGAQSSSRSVPAGTFCIVASICNLPQLEHVHGAGVASRVRHAVLERARQICGFEPGIVSMSGEHMLFVFDTQPWEPPNAPATPRAAVLLERILSRLGGQPVEASGKSLFAVISAVVVPWTNEPFDIAAVAAKAMPAQIGSSAWREGYLADMKTALAMFDALDEEQLGFEWEPVCDVGGPTSIQYYEALLCRFGDGGVERMGHLVPALERVGLVRRLDQWVVETVIDTLRLNPDVCLGCNVSAQSARLDAWWVFILAALSDEPYIASRLVIEITETAPFDDLMAARDFVRSIQSLGCRVALDDVGAGYSTLKTLVELGVDIAKIDRAYVRQAGDDAAATARLGELIALAGTCAKEVVVEGIEHDEDAELSRRSGASGLQGYLFSGAVLPDIRPSVAWRRASE